MDVDDWWTRVEAHMLEASIMSRTRQQAVEAHKVAPWIPPACRGQKVWNTEILKGCICIIMLSFVGIAVQLSSNYKYTDSTCCSSELQLFKSKFQEIVLECLEKT